MEVFPLGSQWELKFSNPVKNPKSEENNPPPRYQKAGYRPGLALTVDRVCASQHLSLIAHQVKIMSAAISYLRQRRRYMFLPTFVCLSVC